MGIWFKIFVNDAKSHKTQKVKNTHNQVTTKVWFAHKAASMHLGGKVISQTPIYHVQEPEASGEEWKHQTIVREET